MRTLRLARSALDAEILRRKLQATRGVRRIVLAVAGALFGLFALALLHVALFFVFELDAGITPAWSAIIVAAIDLILLLLLLVLSTLGGPGPVEIEARLVRDRSLTEMRSSLALATLTGPAARFAGRGAYGAVRRVLRRRS